MHQNRNNFIPEGPTLFPIDGCILLITNGNIILINYTEESVRLFSSYICQSVFLLI